MAARKSVLLTGGTGVIGRIFVEELVRAGYAVLLATRDRPRAEAQIEELPSAERDFVTVVQVDLENVDEIGRLGDALQELGRQPVHLVNNARARKFLETGAEGLVSTGNWMGEFLLDVVVPYRLTMMLASAGKSALESVVNIASIYGVTAPNLKLYETADQSPINYGVCKAAQIHLTRELSVRLAPHKIRVNSISYGGLRGRVDEQFEKRYESLCPSGRMLEDADIAGPLRFLLSDSASGMTGHNLVVDGGWTVW